jgi:hypothetical protein
MMGRRRAKTINPSVIVYASLTVGAVAGGLAIWKPLLFQPASKTRPVHVAAPKVPTAVTTPAAAPSAPQFVTRHDIAWRPDDPYATRFLDELGVECDDGEEVSMRTFLELQMEQARGYGIITTYRVMSNTSMPKPMVLVSKSVRSTSGNPLVGIPQKVIFWYVADWPSMSFYRATPRTPETDPIAAINRYYVAACNNNYIRLHHAEMAAHARSLPGAGHTSIVIRPTPPLSAPAPAEPTDRPPTPQGNADAG